MALTSSPATHGALRSEEHTSELQSRENLVCRLLLEKKKKTIVESEDNDVTWAIQQENTCTYETKPSHMGQGEHPEVTIDTAGRIYIVLSTFVTSAGV